MNGISLLTAAETQAKAEAVGAVIDLYPLHLRQRMKQANVRVVLLASRERYADASKVLRRLNVVDDWPIPPAGLFVVDERTVYLRSQSRMTIVHEMGHALDMSLGDGVYLSAVDPRFRKAFADAKGFVTPYAGSGLDEYFAEGCRAMIGVNDLRCPWPDASRDRLGRFDQPMLGLLDAIWAPEYR